MKSEGLKGLARGLGLAAVASVIAVTASIMTGPAMADSSRILDLMAGKMDAGNTVSLSADVKCSPDASYALWATSEGAQSFYAPRATVGQETGGAYTVAFFPDEDPAGNVHGTAGAHVLARDPGHFFAFEWIVFAGDDKKGENAPPYAPETLRRPAHLPTWVEINFTPNASGTHVEFRHFGFADGELWQRSQAWFTRAWGGVLSQMKAHCEKHAG